VKVWSKSVGTEGYFTREHERVSHLYLAHQWSVVTETSCLKVPAFALQPGKVWSKSVCNEWHFTREAEIFFSSRSRLALYRRDGNITSGTPSAWAASNVGLVEVGR
jgi:hypothetical protein